MKLLILVLKWEEFIYYDIDVYLIIGDLIIEMNNKRFIFDIIEWIFNVNILVLIFEILIDNELKLNLVLIIKGVNMF